MRFRRASPTCPKTARRRDCSSTRASKRTSFAGTVSASCGRGHAGATNGLKAAFFAGNSNSVRRAAARRCLCRELGSYLNIMRWDPAQEIRTLSGGNQQKALLARWLATSPKVLIVDEPTRGIDIGAKAEIHRLLREYANAGNGVIVVSSEMPELLGLCDRIIVLHEGHWPAKSMGAPLPKGNSSILPRAPLLQIEPITYQRKAL